MFTVSKSIKDTCMDVVNALDSGNSDDISNACEAFHLSIVNSVMSKLDDSSKDNLSNFDKKILAARGIRQLTSVENKWYKNVIDVAKSANPKQAFIELLSSSDEGKIMPTSILEQVFKDLSESFELFSILNFNYVGYLTRFILNNNENQKAVWGSITAEITKEITGNLKVIDIKQHKLTAFAKVEMGMLDMGPSFLDAYLRTCLKMALLNGLEEGIILGNGLNQPIGMMKSIAHGVSVNQSTGYPDKTPLSIDNFNVKNYCNAISNLAESEYYSEGGKSFGGKPRLFNEVALIVNQKEYLKKIMPATIVQATNGSYVRDLFPFPTRVIRANSVPDGRAILCLPDRYFLGVGNSKDGVIEFSDEYEFLEDMRVFKIKQYATGQFEDDTCCIVLDIENLDPAYITVANVVSD